MLGELEVLKRHKTPSRWGFHCALGIGVCGRAVAAEHPKEGNGILLLLLLLLVQLLDFQVFEDFPSSSASQQMTSGAGMLE